MRPRIATVALLFAVAACGADARQKALRTSLQALNASREGFVAWDARAQAELVTQAPSLEAGHAALRAHRDRRDPVVGLFVAAYSALALAALEPTGENLLRAAEDARRLYEAIRKLTGRL